MRSFKILLACVIIGFTLFSCKKDFLERSPESVISDAQYWQSANDLKLYANGFYTAFPSYTGFGTIGIYGDDADQGSDNMIYISYNTWMNGETIVPSTGGGWSSWGTLRNINYLLANYGKVKDSWTNMKPYVGEALFFRAYFYFGMMKRFGALPWVTKPLTSTSPELYSKRLARNVIADSILADLDSAISYLPSKTASSAGRVYKEYVMAFQSRVALFEGTWEKYLAGTLFGVTGSNGGKYLQKAADAANKVMSTGIFSLDNVGKNYGYWSLFNQTDYSGSKEVMFWRQYNATTGPAHNWHRYTNSGAGRGLTKSLVDDYLCIDGNPIALSPLYQGDDSLTTVVRGRDPRLAQTMYVNDGNHIVTNNQPGGVPNLIFTLPTFGSANENKPATGYQVYKGNNPDYFQQYAAEIGTTGLILFRYAEVLLNYAEAKAELGTLTQGDVDMSINKLRQRVGMPDMNIGALPIDPNWIFPNLSPVINEVRRERRVELACEGFRHDDVLRWGAAGRLFAGWQPLGAKLNQWATVVPASQLSGYPTNAAGYIQLYKNSPAMASGYKFNVNRDYLSPLPLSELQVPNSVMEQNPNW
ncbi:RagB/SusD family nutrient uptake outer membrane protein [Chitinophaga polysaccharea]|uniref:RagB/SusD family nutrient uptake outer membrane protein n=1 Tax=Chitinophaga polysaccharea TaxID=1293035 RepID=UPI001455C82B|nr:RagB/SusD family nutrient uptake outer membrane protein [Chitinophaga polysaccharea]NLR56796.1 RagB/SusD family nutrient uptake outer membrane protein [Chitinophaga polysaccharea]